MFEATITDRQPELLIELEGELDMASAPRLTGLVQRVMDAGYPHVTLDMERLAFADSTGLNAIARLARRAADSGVELDVVRAAPFLSRVMAITGLDVAILTRPA